MARVYNFSAGPSMLPEEVLRQAADEMLDYQGSGQSVMEMSHRSKVYDKIIKDAEADLREIMNIHADYRLVSSRVLKEFADFKEVNIFLRGMFPLVGFKSTCVYYERSERLAGKSHYPLSKMLGLAIDGITSLSIKPIRFITGVGIFVALLSFVGVIWSVVEYFLHNSITGWASTVSIICFIGGIQLISLGVIGEYIGKMYMETKSRPRYIISERTFDRDGEKE